jgi:hypothetical protein
MEVFLGKPLHPNEQAAAMVRPARPLFNKLIEGLPSPKVEIPYTKVRSGG